jgi:hypothetical protein
MNLQEILEPVESLFVWTFESIIQPLGNIPNNLCIILGFIGLGIWLKRQKKYTAEAKRTGGMV